MMKIQCMNVCSLLLLVLSSGLSRTELVFHYITRSVLSRDTSNYI